MPTRLRDCRTTTLRRGPTPRRGWTPSPSKPGGCPAGRGDHLHGIAQSGCGHRAFCASPALPQCAENPHRTRHGSAGHPAWETATSRRPQPRQPSRPRLRRPGESTWPCESGCRILTRRGESERHVWAGGVTAIVTSREVTYRARPGSRGSRSIRAPDRWTG
jgi:hypothetical protein